MSRKAPVRTAGIMQQLRDVLTNDWQLIRLLCAQIVFPPDSLNRRALERKIGKGRSCTEVGAKSSIAAQTIRRLIDSGFAERRKSPIDGKYEYRLSQTTKQEIQK